MARAWSASLGVLQVMATAIISAVVFGWWLAPVLIGRTSVVEAAEPGFETRCY